MREKLTSVYDEITDRRLFKVEIEYSAAVDDTTGEHVEGFLVSQNGCPVLVTRSEGHSFVRVARMSLPLTMPVLLPEPTDAQIIEAIRRAMA